MAERPRYFDEPKTFKEIEEEEFYDWEEFTFIDPKTNELVKGKIRVMKPQERQYT